MISSYFVAGRDICPGASTAAKHSRSQPVSWWPKKCFWWTPPPTLNRQATALSPPGSPGTWWFPACPSITCKQPPWNLTPVQEKTGGGRQLWSEWSKLFIQKKVIFIRTRLNSGLIKPWTPNLNPVISIKPVGLVYLDGLVTCGCYPIKDF